MFALRKTSLAVLCLFGLVPLVYPQGVSEAGKANPSAKPGAAPFGNRYAGEAVVVEKLDNRFRYAADGTGSRQTTMVLLVQTEAAVRQFGVVNIPYAGNEEHVEIDYVRVRRPDGSVVATPAAEALAMPAEVTRQAPLYSDLKEMQVPVRNLQVGDRLEYQVRVVQTKAEPQGQFWGSYSPVQNTVVLAESTELRVPKSRDVTVWSPSSKPVTTEDGADRIYRWTASATDPTVGKEADAKKEADKKRVLSETEQLDRTEGKLPVAAWTTFKSWDQVGAWYRALEADRIVPDADVKAKAAELIAGEKTEEAKIEPIYHYVATQIRYIGIDFGVGKFQPHPAGDVLSNQYGDCKDKHTLLAAMLGAAGIQANAVLIGAGIRFNPDVPSPAAFNHVITLVPAGGQNIWLDSTQEVAPYRVLLPVLRDRKSLVVPLTGVSQIEKTPAELPFKAFGEFDAKASVDQNGTVNSHIVITMRGDEGVGMREALHMLSPGQYGEFIQRISQALGFSGATSNVEVSRPDATADPLHIAYDYKREKGSEWSEYKIVPELTVIYLPVVDEKSPPQVPINLGSRRVETVKSEMKLPDGWGATLPDAVHVHTPFATYDKTYRFEHGTLYADRRIEVLQEKIPASSWKAYKKFVDDAGFAAGEPWVQLTSSVTKAGESGPPLPSVNNNQAADLITQAVQAGRSWDLDGAVKLLDQAKKLNSKQRMLWQAYGYIATLRGAMIEAAADFRKEINLHPDEHNVYLALAQSQLMANEKDEAKQTLQSGLAQGPNPDIALMLGAILASDQAYADEVRLLSPVASKYPDNMRLQLLLGEADIRSDHKEEGARILATLLKNSTDPMILNDASYELADKGMNLDLAEASALKAVEMRTKETAALTIDSDPKAAKATVQLLAAAWDTLGWIYFQEHKPNLAEGYLRAAWFNATNSTVGLHLGQVQEAHGQFNQALATYEMAQAANEPYRRNNSQNTNSAVDRELSSRIALLRHKGAKKPSVSGDIALQNQRELRIGPADGRSGTAEYTLLMQGGHISAVKKTGDNTVSGGDELASHIDITGWWPKDSTAKILRQGILNCYSGVCEFVMLPMQ